jgi:hypothetical protein
VVFARNQIFRNEIGSWFGNVEFVLDGLKVEIGLDLEFGALAI